MALSSSTSILTLRRLSSGRSIIQNDRTSRRRIIQLSFLRNLTSNQTAAAAPSNEDTNNTNNDNNNTPDIPPIKWTTHKLSPESIAKVDRIFHKILWLDMVQTSMLTDSINYKLGHKIKFTPKQRTALEKQLQGDTWSGSNSSSTTDEAAEAEVAGPVLVELKLTGFDAKSKIKVIKEVRAMAGLGLKEAKELVESAPAVIQKDLKQEQADELKAKLEELGATVEVV